MSNKTPDEILNEVALKQAIWKNTKLLTACLTIAEKALKHGVFWPDEVDLACFLTENDRNVIGIAYRVCGNTLEIIEQTGQYRKSKATGANGRVIFQYRIINDAMAKAFLKRYDKAKYEALCHPQLDLFR